MSVSFVVYEENKMPKTEMISSQPKNTWFSFHANPYAKETSPKFCGLCSDVLIIN